MKRLAAVLIALVATAAWSAPPELLGPCDRLEVSEHREALERRLQRSKKLSDAEVEALSATMVALPTAYAGEMANDPLPNGDRLLLHVPYEFYILGEDLNPSVDWLHLDIKNLTPAIAKCRPAPTPTNGCSVEPVPGATGLARFSVIYGNRAGLYEKLIEVRVLPAGSLTLHVEDGTYDFRSVYEARSLSPVNQEVP